MSWTVDVGLIRKPSMDLSSKYFFPVFPREVRAIDSTERYEYTWARIINASNYVFSLALFSFPNCFWQLIPPLFKVAWYIFLELSTTDCYQSVKVQHVVFTWNAFFPPMSTHYSPPPHTHLEVIYEYALTPKELQWRLPCTARKDYAYPLFPIMPHYSDVIAIL